MSVEILNVEGAINEIVEHALGHAVDNDYSPDDEDMLETSFTESANMLNFDLTDDEIENGINELRQRLEDAKSEEIYAAFRP